MRRRTKHAGLPRMAALYVACASPFREVDEFIAYAASPTTGYHMDLYTVHAPMKEALARYLSGAPSEALGSGSGGAMAPVSDLPAPRDVQAMFIGVRETDPHGSKIGVRSPCDPGWPPIMRVHPILDWDYADVWAFLRCPVLGTPAAALPQFVGGGGTDGVPYCSLYDAGYTSLGSTHNTHPNPYLQVQGTTTYRPAYCLEDGSSERAGRG